MRLFRMSLNLSASSPVDVSSESTSLMKENWHHLVSCLSLIAQIQSIFFFCLVFAKLVLLCRNIKTERNCF